MQKNRLYFIFPLSVLLLFISACSSTHEAYIRTIKLAFSEQQELSLTSEQIKQSPVDLIYVKQDDSPSIILALAFIEQGQYKWVSVDQAALIERNGRLIKTLSLHNNLDFISSTSDDPLIHPEKISDKSEWLRQIDFNSMTYGLGLHSKFTVLGKKQLSLQDKIIETVLIEERVELINDGMHDYGEMTWVNQFWLHEKTGQLLQSKQKTLPNGQYFSITYISRAMRL